MLQTSAALFSPTGDDAFVNKSILLLKRFTLKMSHIVK